MRRVQFVIDEYNIKGWNQQDTLKGVANSINDDVSEDSSGRIKLNQLEQFKEDYKGDTITSKDIFLPPFLDGLTNE